jgi:hypothetical protein
MNMTDDQIKYMVNRFLSWKLPADFSPDGGVSYTRPNYAPEVDATPSGTNLLDATQVDAMVRHMIEGLPDARSEPVFTSEQHYDWRKDPTKNPGNGY